MKKVIIILCILAPCLCFGQRKDILDIKNTKQTKTVSTGTKSILEKNISDIIKIKNLEEKEFWFNCRGDNKTKVNALVLIDGVENNINKLLPEDIESFTVLTEKNEIAEYGEAGKNGVILITTKEYVKKHDREEYDVIVFDAGYESFLATQKSKDFYTESFLKAKNILMVNEWNYRYRLPKQYNPNIYEVSIDYNTNTNYGLDVEYKIYMFFRFMEKEHNMSLIEDRLIVQM